MNVVAVAVVSVVSAKPAPAGQGKAAPPPVAVKDGPGELDAPLRALEGKGDGASRNDMLGGATVRANDLTVCTSTIVKRDEAQRKQRQTTALCA